MGTTASTNLVDSKTYVERAIAYAETHPDPTLCDEPPLNVAMFPRMPRLSPHQLLKGGICRHPMHGDTPQPMVLRQMTGTKSLVFVCPQHGCPSFYHAEQSDVVKHCTFLNIPYICLPLVQSDDRWEVLERVPTQPVDWKQLDTEIVGYDLQKPGDVERLLSYLQDMTMSARSKRFDELQQNMDTGSQQESEDFKRRYEKYKEELQKREAEQEKREQEELEAAAHEREMKHIKDETCASSSSSSSLRKRKKEEEEEKENKCIQPKKQKTRAVSDEKEHCTLPDVDNIQR